MDRLAMCLQFGTSLPAVQQLPSHTWESSLGDVCVSSHSSTLNGRGSLSQSFVDENLHSLVSLKNNNIYTHADGGQRFICTNKIYLFLLQTSSNLTWVFPGGTDDFFGLQKIDLRCSSSLKVSK